MLPKSDAAKYAANHSNTTLLPNGKIRFDETGMDFPSTVTLSVLDAYASGKAFRRAVARRANEAYDFSVHQPHIVPHRNRDERHFLYCTLTGATLPRDRDIVQKHVSAKKFQRRLAKAEEAKKKKQALAEKRREKREKAKTARTSKGEQDEKSGLEQSPEDVDDRMEEENDILNGIISDDDGDDGDDDDDDSVNEEQNKSSKPKRSIKQIKGKPAALSPNNDAMDEDGAAEEDDAAEKDDAVEGMTEEKDVFWTRGRKGTRSIMDGDENEDDNDDDDDDEWGESSRKTPSKHKTKKKTKRIPAKESVENARDSAPVIKNGDIVAGKRNRNQVQVPKRIRRERQRQKRTQET